VQPTQPAFCASLCMIQTIRIVLLCVRILVETHIHKNDAPECIKIYCENLVVDIVSSVRFLGSQKSQ